MAEVSRQQWYLAGAIPAWTLIAWGGRIGLLTGGESWSSTVRIGGSLLIGVATSLVLVIPKLNRAIVPVLYLFALWTVINWGRSLIVNWTGSGSIPFKMVHTILGVGFFVLAALAARTAARSNAIPGPDERDGYEQRDGESASLP